VQRPRVVVGADGRTGLAKAVSRPTSRLMPLRLLLAFQRRTTRFETPPDPSLRLV
jgi:hypothetical protein